ncbi:MAG: alpha/beta hydrolase [Clostridia bacterium]
MNAEHYLEKMKKDIHVYTPHSMPDPDAVVVVVPGMAEHGKRYWEFADFLKGKNIQMIAVDHPGHGIHTKNPGVWPENGFFLCLDNLKYVLETVKREYPLKKIILFGHSMGSFLSLGFLEHYGYLVDMCVLSGSNDKPSPALLFIGRLVTAFQSAFSGRDKASALMGKLTFGSYNKPFEPAETPFDWLSRDKDRVQSYVNDPLCGFISSAGLYHDLAVGLSYIFKNANIRKIQKELPVHILSGSQDPVGQFGKGPAALNLRLSKAGIQNVSIRLYASNRHECLNELNREEVMNDVYGWIYSGISPS